MRTDLVRPSRHQFHFQQGQIPLLPHHAVLGDNFLVARPFRIADRYGIVRGVLAQISVQGVCVFRHFPVHHAVIELPHLVVADFFVHFPQGNRVLCGNHNASRVAVDAVAERGREGLLGGGVVFPLLRQVRPDVQNQRILPCGGILVNQHPGAFVEQENVFVLVHNIQLRLNPPDCAAVLLGRIEEFVADKQLYLVPLAKHLVLLGPRAVDLDFFRADILVRQRLRKPPDRLGKEFVKPLSRVVLSDLQYSHIKYKARRDATRLSALLRCLLLRVCRRSGRPHLPDPG